MRTLRRRFVKKPAHAEEMSLQITSMADIFTIILVFLMKSYATGTLTVQPADGITLPSAQITPDEQDKHAPKALTVEISDSSILLEGKAVTKISGFLVPNLELMEDGSIKSLQAAFKAADLDRKSGQTTAAEAVPPVMIIADQRAPYATLKAVLASAAGQGYTNVKLAVATEE